MKPFLFLSHQQPHIKEVDVCSVNSIAIAAIAVGCLDIRGRILVNNAKIVARWFIHINRLVLN